MEIVDPTVVNVALPHMAGSLGEVQRQAQMPAFCDDYWFFTLVILVLLPLVLLMRRAARAEGSVELPH